MEALVQEVLASHSLFHHLSTVTDQRCEGCFTAWKPSVNIVISRLKLIPLDSQDARQFPFWKIGLIAFCLVLVCISNVIKLLYVQCGSAEYWGLMAVLLPFPLAL